MVERVAQHRHCRHCDRAIPLEQEYCSENCEHEHAALLQGKRRQLLVFYAVAVLLVVLLVVLQLLA